MQRLDAVGRNQGPRVPLAAGEFTRPAALTRTAEPTPDSSGQLARREVAPLV